MVDNIFNSLYGQVFDFNRKELIFFQNLIQYLESIELGKLNAQINRDFTKFQVEHREAPVANGYVKENSKTNDEAFNTRLRSIRWYLINMLKHLYTFDKPSAPGVIYDDIMLGKIRLFCEISKNLISEKIGFDRHEHRVEYSCRGFNRDHAAMLDTALPVKNQVRGVGYKPLRLDEGQRLSIFKKIHSNWNQLSNKNKAVFLGVLAFQVAAIITLAIVLPGSPLVTVAGGAVLSLKILSGMAMGVSLTAQVTYGCYRLFNKKTAVLNGADTEVDRISLQSAKGTDL